VNTTAPSGERCECGHSGTAHIRDRTHACAFCECGRYLPDAAAGELAPRLEPNEVTRALQLLGENPAFAGVTSWHLSALGRRGRKRLFMAGSILMDKGDSSDRLYFLLKGVVQVERPAAGALPALSAELGPGDIVGEVGLLHGHRHTATVTALEDLRVLEINKDDLQAVFHEDHALLLAFLRMVHHRLKVAPTGA
jgi:signal-transduction protein with cAMP-binding, CBS, and nucleotidyltransferase domain